MGKVYHPVDVRRPRARDLRGQGDFGGPELRCCVSSEDPGIFDAIILSHRGTEDVENVDVGIRGSASMRGARLEDIRHPRNRALSDARSPAFALPKSRSPIV